MTQGLSRSGRRCPLIGQMILAPAGKSRFTPLQTHPFGPPVFRVEPMRLRLTGVALGASALLSLAWSVGAGAALVPVYRNVMESPSQRGEAVKLSGARCGRGGS